MHVARLYILFFTNFVSWSNSFLHPQLTIHHWQWVPCSSSRNSYCWCLLHTKDCYTVKSSRRSCHIAQYSSGSTTWLIRYQRRDTREFPFFHSGLPYSYTGCCIDLTLEVISMSICRFNHSPFHLELHSPVCKLNEMINAPSRWYIIITGAPALTSLATN
jgi:hypothetical protein